MKNYLFTIGFILTSFNILAQCDDSVVLDLTFSGNANDLSPYSNHGFVNGAQLTPDRFGNLNSAYFFDGINDEITIPDNSTLDLTEEWTISVWVKPGLGYGSFQSNHLSIVDKWGEGGIGKAAYTLGIAEGGFLEGLTYSGNVGTYSHTDEIVPVHVWSHLVVTRNSDSLLSYYIDGVLDKEVEGSEIPQNSTFPLKIGMAASPTVNNAFPQSFRFKGNIDDVKIYTCAISIDEINSIGVLESNEAEINFNIVQNPVQNLLKIKCNDNRKYSLEVYNNLGKLIRIYNTIQNPIDLSYLETGVYFGKILNEEGKFLTTKKIIKQ